MARMPNDTFAQNVKSLQGVSSGVPLEEKLKLATELLDRLQEQIRGVDEKVRALFTANTLLTAALAFVNQDTLLSLQEPWRSVMIAANIVMFVSVVASVVLAVSALMPRVQSSGRAGLFFFGDIAKLPLDGFVEGFTQQPTDEALTQILTQAYDSAKISQAKHGRMWWSGSLLIFALSLWVWILVFNLLTS